jgi:branched-chain amino acid transport system ATP-binding protein
MKILETKSLRAYYGKALILRGLDIYVDKNETIAILGPNGAGKTTLLKSILGLVRTEGEIKFYGENIDGLRPYDRIRKGIAICPEGRKLFPHMTVEDNLILGARDGDYRDRLEFVYNLFPEIKRRRRHLAKLTSGGEQQMVAIGRALMSNPKLLLLDEPSLGLAPIIINRIRDALREIISQEDIQIMMVEQNIKLAFDLADRIYVIVKGEIVGEGTTETLRGLEKQYFETI